MNRIQSSVRASRLAGLLATGLLIGAVNAAPTQVAQDQGGATGVGSGLTPPDTLGPGVFPAEPVRQLRLRDGRTLWGWIEEHSPDELRVLRLDNGGRATFGWGLLTAEQERELKRFLGYVDLEDLEPKILATRVRTASGDEFIGDLTSESPEAIELKTLNGILTIPRAQLVGALTTEQVPARELYTREELYERRLDQDNAKTLLVAEDTPPAQLAELHWEIARYCETIYHYAMAKYHYDALLAADPTFTHPDLTASLERTERLSKAQAQVDELELIDRLRARDRFPEALLRVERFTQLYPDSPLEQDLAKLRVKVLRDREREMVAQTEVSWHKWVARLAKERARETSYEATVSWVQEVMSDEVARRVAEDMRRYQSDADDTRARELWNAREPRRDRRATYGLGTWILGREAALAEIQRADEKPQDDEGPLDPRSEERKQIEDRIQRYLKSQELASRSSTSAGSEQEDPNEFWEQWTVNSRADWIVAYYVENMGDMRLRSSKTRPCRECQGQGALEFSVTSGDSGPRLLQCHLCRGVPVIRRIAYR